MPPLAPLVALRVEVVLLAHFKCRPGLASQSHVRDALPFEHHVVLVAKRSGDGSDSNVLPENDF